MSTRQKMMFMILIIICMCLVPKTGLSCTTFVLDNRGQPVYGKNADWMEHIPGCVIVNKRGVAKTSAEPLAIPISWTSRFGSVTFNVFARERPQEGINETGLFITILGAEGLAKDEYPEPDSRPPMSGGQLVQYQLDNFSTVNEVIASFQSIQIAKPAENSKTPQMALHWFVSDSRGKCASIEFLDGKMVCHTNWTLPVKVLSNSTYGPSLAYFRRFRFLNLFFPIPLPEDSGPALNRFVIAADMVKKYRPKRSVPAVDYAFQILQDVEMNPAHHTALWSAVYDSANKQIYFRSWNNDQIRSINLSALDFSCTTPVKVLDITADLAGDVSNNFVDYTKEIDLEMLNSWWLTDAAINYLFSYPDTTVCTE